MEKEKNIDLSDDEEIDSEEDYDIFIQDITDRVVEKLRQDYSPQEPVLSSHKKKIDPYSIPRPIHPLPSFGNQTCRNHRTSMSMKLNHSNTVPITSHLQKKTPGEPLKPTLQRYNGRSTLPVLPLVKNTLLESSHSVPQLRRNVSKRPNVSRCTSDFTMPIDVEDTKVTDLEDLIASVDSNVRSRSSSNDILESLENDDTCK